MPTNTLPDPTRNMLDKITHTADQVAETAADQALSATHRGVQAVRDSSQQALQKMQRASEVTVNYVKDEPVKAMLIAAATGAALMALMGLLSRSRGDRG